MIQESCYNCFYYDGNKLMGVCKFPPEYVSLIVPVDPNYYCSQYIEKY